MAMTSRLVGVIPCITPLLKCAAPVPGRAAIRFRDDNRQVGNVISRAPDFRSLFAEGRTHDFGHVRPGLVAVVRVADIGELLLPTGRLVVCDPWSYSSGVQVSAFAQRVEPGVYRTQLVLADFHDSSGDKRFEEVAAARVVIRDDSVARWEPALFADGQHAHLVDGGMGSFGSPEAFDALSSDSLLGLLAEDRPDGMCGYPGLVFFRPADGVHTTWLGRTACGDVACFVTDFAILR